MKKDSIMYHFTNTLSRIVYLPSDGDIAQLPLLVYLHRAGQRGSDLQLLPQHGLPRLIEEGRDYPAVVLCPQCPAQLVWDNVTVQLKATIDETVKTYGLHGDRVVLTGCGMGGFGTWMMGATYPGFFAGIAPVAGGGMSWRADDLAKTPVLAVHGDRDTVVPLDYSRLMIDELNKKGHSATLRVLEGCGHDDSIDRAYRQRELTDWLLQQRL